MSYPTTDDVLTIPVHSGESERNILEVPWNQSCKSRTAHYYLVNAQNQSKGRIDIMIFIQDRFYADSGSCDYIGRLPGARLEGSKLSDRSI